PILRRSPTDTPATFLATMPYRAMPSRFFFDPRRSSHARTSFTCVETSVLLRVFMGAALIICSEKGRSHCRRGRRADRCGVEHVSGMVGEESVQETGGVHNVRG